MNSQTTKQAITKKSYKSTVIPKTESKITYTKYDSENSLSVNPDVNYSEPVSYVTKNMDTLYLVNNDLGKMIKSVWTDNKYNENPVILLVDVLPIRPEPIKIKKQKNL
jgi:hypothetical protein